MRKTCKICAIEKPLEEFSKNARAQYGRHTYCKQCHSIQGRLAYQKRKNTLGFKLLQRERSQRVYARFSKFIRRYKLLKGCIDCGYRAHSAALQFDHVYDKKFGIGNASGRNWEDLKAEIRKCEVRCANCHAVITAQRRFN